MEKFQFKPIYIIAILFLILIFLTYQVIAPFLSGIIGAIILSVTLYPVYKKLKAKIKNQNLASTIMVILVILVILIPLSFVITALVKEVNTAYQSINTESITLLSNKLKEFFGIDLNLEGLIKTSLSNLTKELVNNVSKFFLSLTNKIIEFVIMIFLMFYFFRDGETILKTIKDTIPLEQKYRDALTKEFKSVTYAVIYGFIIAGIAQGLAGGLGFFIFGLPNPILWGLVMAILSIIPIVGPWLIWIPAAIYLIMSGHILSAIFLLIYGIIIISNVDNVVRPFVISSKSNIHPAIILIGVIGGLKFMGIVGIVVGPLILAFLMVFFKFLGGKNVFKSKAN